MTLTYRAEYAEIAGNHNIPRVLLIQEWLEKSLQSVKPVPITREYRLLPHCTERTAALSSIRAWQSVFSQCGLSLRVLPAGCCGMAGTYGHEAEHRSTSEDIYSLSWARHVSDVTNRGNLLATGYSCRSQTYLVDGVKLQHPVQALLEVLRQADLDAMASGVPTQHISQHGYSKN
jgi:Fe-S oxidoreductase